MAEIFKDRIIKLLKHSDYTPLKLAQLAKSLGIGDADYDQFKAAFDKLRRAGHIIIGERSQISLPAPGGRIIGTFRANPRGFGFVNPLEPNSYGDLFIKPDETGGAMTGDIVSAKVVKKGKRAGQLRISGKITEVIERSQNRFVGTLVKHPEGQWIVQPDGTQFLEPISVDDVTAKNARAKDKVVVEILSYPSEKYLARGVIVEVLGRAGRYDTEISSIIHQYHLPEGFEQDCVSQASAAAGDFESDSLNGREDITDKVIATIDPPDAKDFDDAISIEKDSDGNWVLGVHIADVSHFVTDGSPLDIEAAQRGNSVYLPGRTIPMLPEVLSNGVCSLQPDQKRFCKSAYIIYDRKGNVVSRRFANSLICSRQRLTYIQADKALKGRSKGIKPEVLRLLKDMRTLSRVIEKRRTDNGMLHLDLPETELVLDKAGRVVDAVPADTSYPHTIIEMFMVEANEAVATLLDRLNAGFIRRVHPEPDQLSMKNLSRLIKALGLSMPRNPDRFTLQGLLGSVKGKDCSLAVNIAILRSFAKAQYAPVHIGHYALASAQYCHFTSPIRRYADLLVHRALELYLQGKLTAETAAQYSAELDLNQVGEHISFTEQRAGDAENELKAVLILQMLSSRIGEELEGVVTGLTNFGVFVQSKKFGIDGLVRKEDLGPDKWKYNAKTFSIIGQNSGINIHLGMAMKVRIVSVNVAGRQLDVVPCKPLLDERPKRKSAIRSKDKKKNKRRRAKR